MKKDEEKSELVRLAVEAFKIHAAPQAFKEAAAITAYYAFFNNPAFWKAGIRAPHETDVPAVKMSARFKRSFGN